jgi:autotransporter passenger strand-loop-strand repeat protein
MPAATSVFPPEVWQNVASYGTDVLSGGREVDVASDNGSTIAGGGVLQVVNNGLLVSATISSGGTVFVSSGGTASGTVVNSGGTLVVLPGAVATNTELQAGGLVISSALVEFYISGALLSAQSGVISGAHITAGEAQILFDGAITSGTQLSDTQNAFSYYNGVATQTVSSGGQADMTALAGYSNLQVLSGGSANGAVVVGSSASLQISGGDVSGSVVVSGGQMNLSAGLALDTSLSTDAQLAISYGAFAVSTHIGAGGSAFVDGNAAAESITSGGTEIVGGNFFGGGIASGTQVSSGGLELVRNGGVTIGTVVATSWFPAAAWPAARWWNLAELW